MEHPPKYLVPDLRTGKPRTQNMPWLMYTDSNPNVLICRVRIPPALNTQEYDIDIPILTGHRNYEAWVGKVEAVMKARGLWQLLIGEEKIAGYHYRDRRGHCHPLRNETYRILQFSTSEEINRSFYDDHLERGLPTKRFNTLKDRYQKTPYQATVSAIQELKQIKFHPDMCTMSRFIDQLRGIEQRLRIDNELTPDYLLLDALANGLPGEYKEWVTKNILKAVKKPSFDALAKDLITMDRIKTESSRIRRYTYVEVAE